MNPLFSPRILEKMSGPSSGPAEISKWEKDTHLGKLQELEKQLKEAKENNQKREIRMQILQLRRELNRTKQFTEISENTLVEWKTSLDDIKASDLLKVDKESKLRRGEFLSKSFLYKRTTDSEWNIFEEASDGKDLKEGDTLYVDFWKNVSANRNIGAAHMLPVDILYVKINGVIWIRSIINNRIGYYNKNNPSGYLPIFSWDTIEIPKKAEIDAFEKNTSTEWFVKNTDQKSSDEATDMHIARLESWANLPTHVEINKNTQESYNFWISKWFSHAQASGIIANEYRESAGNPRAIWDGWKALWIFQWHPDRRKVILEDTGIDISTASHSEQLEAAWWEMNNVETKVMSPLRSSTTPQDAASIFSRLYERPANSESEEAMRWEMAEAFAILLDPSVKSHSLGDHVVQRGPAKTWPDSCGSAVRELLKSYGITGLPESWADGKNWDDILESKTGQFVRMKVAHPDHAYPWAILVYDGSGSEWSEKNKRYGHVEIKWSDGRYYSYYGSESPGWSAAVNEKDPKKYKDMTGFVGYAYYPRKMH